MDNLKSLQEIMKSLNDITAATEKAIDVLSMNSETANMIAENILLGSIEESYSKGLFQNETNSKDESDEINKIADGIVEKIMSQNELEMNLMSLQSIDLSLPEYISVEKVMSAVNKKLCSAGPNKQNKKDDDNDKFDFGSCIK